MTAPTQKHNQQRKSLVLLVTIKKKKMAMPHRQERLNATKMREKKSWKKTRKTWLSTSQRLNLYPATLFPTDGFGI
jgi:hypothetical protein